MYHWMHLLPSRVPRSDKESIAIGEKREGSIVCLTPVNDCGGRIENEHRCHILADKIKQTIYSRARLFFYEPVKRPENLKSCH
jgi:hypothetical protein